MKAQFQFINAQFQFIMKGKKMFCACCKEIEKNINIRKTTEKNHYFDVYQVQQPKQNIPLTQKDELNKNIKAKFYKF